MLIDMNSAGAASYSTLSPWCLISLRSSPAMRDASSGGSSCNDGWFGRSPGPYQHFASARFRAVEEGLPLARAANTGISAVIDPLGRVTKSLPLGAEGVMDAALPRRIEPTLYARTGDAGIAVVIGAGLILIVRRRARRA